MKRICTALGAIAIFFGITSCSDTMYKAVKYENIPVDIGNTTLLVPKYEHEDPMVYDPVYVKGSGDSIRKVSPFKYSAGKMDTIKQAEKKEHPLIVETNKHLDEYNKNLEKTWKKYKYKYVLVEASKLDQMPNYDDKNTYKYILMRKPVLHCYENPDGTTLLSYRIELVHYGS